VVKEKMKRLVAYVTEEEHRQLKILMVKSGKSVTGWMHEKVKELLSKSDKD
jgi:hypothetical protein